LQLAWQVGGLVFLWAVASPQSKREWQTWGKAGSAKMQRILQELETKYTKK
jgi:hypothetical protein